MCCCPCLDVDNALNVSRLYQSLYPGYGISGFIKTGVPLSVTHLPQANRTSTRRPYAGESPMHNQGHPVGTDLRAVIVEFKSP